MSDDDEATAASAGAPSADASSAATGEGPAADAPGPLVRLRADEETRWGATAIAVVLGLGLSAVHWLGLVVGGAAVALPRQRAGHAPLAGLAFGVVVLLAFVLGTPTASVGELLALQPPIFVAVAAALVLPVLGSLVRGVV